MAEDVDVPRTATLHALPEAATDPQGAERSADDEAARLRTLGYSYREIATAMNCSVSTAFERVHRALALEPTDADQRRLVEERRLDDLWKIAWREAIRANAPPVQVLQAVATLLKIADRRARLFGLDSPMQVEARIEVRDAIDAEIERLAGELAPVE